MNSNVEKLFLTGTPEEVDKMLTFFLHECPSTMIPSRAEVRRWAALLESRLDKEQFESDIRACLEW